MDLRPALRPLAAGLALLCAGLATHVSVRVAAQEHPGQYSPADVAQGARLYGAQCATCHGPSGDLVGGIDLRRGRFRTASSDDDLKRIVKAGVPGTAMPSSNFNDAEITAVIAFIRAGFELNAAAVMVGDGKRGRVLFDGKGACAKCHRVNGRGPYAAPDLTDVGSLRSPAALQLAMLDPTGYMQPINRSVRVVLRDGRTVRGRRLNEDTYSIQLIDDQERLQSVSKADVREYEIIATSPMPSYKDKLTPAEIGDLVAYLISLRG